MSTQNINGPFWVKNYDEDVSSTKNTHAHTRTHIVLCIFFKNLLQKYQPQSMKQSVGSW